uniref:F-box associated domain-containing protein n=1 Tax=Aegilops tauschii TaxID=37682 RepID=M8C6S8_AEGTA
MVKAARPGAMPLHRRGGGLPDEIVVWEILVRLPPKSLLRCRMSPKYIEAAPEVTMLSASMYVSVLIHDRLHWYPQDRNDSKLVLVFDSITESFRHIRAPIVLAYSDIFEMDNALGMYSYNADIATVDIWALQNYENEIWDNKYRVELPVEKIRGRFGRLNGGFDWDVSVVSVDGDVLLLVSKGHRPFCVDTDGKMVDKFHRAGQQFYVTGLRLKQTLVPHNFFAALGGYAVNALPFI